MRVAMYYKNSDVRTEELPRPKIGAGELLVKVIASGICGSDVLEWYRIKTAPRVLGSRNYRRDRGSRRGRGEIPRRAAGVRLPSYPLQYLLLLSA